MYDINAIRRFISKKGIDNAISYLSGDLDNNLKKELTKCHLFVDGYLNISLIYSLA